MEVLDRDNDQTMGRAWSLGGHLVFTDDGHVVSFSSDNRYELCRTHETPRLLALLSGLGLRQLPSQSKRRKEFTTQTRARQMAVATDIDA